MATLFGVVYMDQYPVTSKTVININGVLNLIILHLAFDSVFAVVNSFALERPVFMREHFNRKGQSSVAYIHAACFVWQIVETLIFSH